MENIQNYLNKYKEPVKKTRTSERAELVKEIYSVYTSEQQRLFRKKENWKRYIQWLKDNKTQDTFDLREKFKKNKKFVKEHSIKTICFFLAHIPVSDLYYIVSMAKDYQNRNNNFSAYLMSSIRFDK